MELPADDHDFSKRVGRIKTNFSRTCRSEVQAAAGHVPALNQRREALIWQRPFWEHTIRDETDLQRHMDYIHYNPVKHGVARCPHDWPYSSFDKWVAAGVYGQDWYCVCRSGQGRRPEFKDIESQVGE